MIETAREWITSVIVVTMLISVAQMLLPDGTIRRIFSFTGGLILLIALLQPILRVDLNQLDLGLEAYEEAIRERQGELEKSAYAELEGIIGDRVAAYISDKADTLGLTVRVRVRMEPGEDGVPVPAAVEIAGEPSEPLAAYMEEELGIPRERQVWSDEGEN